MATLLAIPIFGLLLMIQSAIISQMALLHGTADLLLLVVIAWALQKRVRTAWQWSIIAGLMVTLVSALPLGVPIVMYTLSAGLAQILKQRVWQVPILAMFVTTFFASLLSQLVALGALQITGNPISFIQAINVIVLPSILLNLFLSIPIYALLGDLAHWLYPEALDV